MEYTVWNDKLPTYWYFVYQIKSTEGQILDDAVIASHETVFPLSSVMKMFKENFSEKEKILILNTTQINDESFYKMKDLYETEGFII